MAGPARLRLIAERARSQHGTKLADAAASERSQAQSRRAARESSRWIGNCNSLAASSAKAAAKWIMLANQGRHQWPPFTAGLKAVPRERIWRNKLASQRRATSGPGERAKSRTCCASAGPTMPINIRLASCALGWPAFYIPSSSAAAAAVAVAGFGPDFGSDI